MQNNTNTTISESVASELCDAITDAFKSSSVSLERFAEEFCNICTELERNAILTTQTNVLKWAIRYNNMPRVFRPVCLHYFKKWARKYNDVVCTIYPPVSGAPMPVEELVNVA